jgi:uncharacterized protein (TIGR03435 family)
MTLRAFLAVIGVFVVGVAAQEQSPKSAAPAAPAFEVASVKSHPTPSDSPMSWRFPPGRMTVTNNPLRMIIQGAYRDIVRMPFQLVGGPGWIDSDRFDITAKLPDGAPPEQAVTLLMLQSLLADRFKLVVHKEARETQIYALVLARDDGRLGSNLKRTTVDCAAIRAERRAGQDSPGFAGKLDDPPLCRSVAIGRRDGDGGITAVLGAGGTTMSNLATLLTPYAGRIVVDKTGVAGEFDLVLQFAPPGGPSTNPAGDAVSVAVEERPSIFTALQEQLGLTLESQRGPVEYLVIDSVEQPTPD